MGVEKAGKDMILEDQEDRIMLKLLGINYFQSYE